VSYQERGRAWRRMQSERAKERVRARQGWWLLRSSQYLSSTLMANGYFKQVYLDVKTVRGSLEERTTLGRWSKTRCPCSCFSCGNERNWTGKFAASTRRNLEESSYQEY